MIKHIMTSAVLMMSGVLSGSNGLQMAARTQAFSADLVTTLVGGTPNRQPGHVYVSDGKVRIETPALADGFFIVDGERSAAWFVRPRQRLFMAAKQSSPLTQVLVPVDPHDPCQRWEVMDRLAAVADGGGAWQCQLLGPDLVDGRETLKYLAMTRQNRRSYRWIDLQRAFPVKLESEDGTIVTLEHIVDAPQPESLFVIPPDYHQFDPAQLIEIIKRSDVWIETPR